MYPAIINNRGFSLIELLVAFTISVAALAVMFQIYVKGTTSAILGEEFAQAISIAESRLAMASVEQYINNPSYEGIALNKYQWTVFVTDFESQSTSDELNVITLKEVNVNVAWHSRGRDRHINLKTIKPEFKE
jgi:general secretion pathway protein I